MKAIHAGSIGGRAARLMQNKSPEEYRQLVAERPGTLHRVVTAPSTRSMRVAAEDGWSVELSWSGEGDARLDLLHGDAYESGVRLSLHDARRLARGLRLLCDAMERAA